MKEFFQNKYTNKELYQWQLGQLSSVYFQSYKLAYDLASGQKGVSALSSASRMPVTSISATGTA